MRAHECFHCKQWIEEGEEHDCWTTTERALTEDLSEDLRDAWERLRETAAEFGEQRIYASHNSIMFSRQACYFFVRPKRNFLEVWMVLGRPVNAPPIKRVLQPEKVKVWHMVHIKHRDQVETPVTDWLREAYDQSDELTAKARVTKRSSRTTTSTKPKTTKATKATRAAKAAKVAKLANAAKRPGKKAAARTADAAKNAKKKTAAARKTGAMKNAVKKAKRR
jgi:hypothetical protein